MGEIYGRGDLPFGMEVEAADVGLALAARRYQRCAGIPTNAQNELAGPRAGSDPAENRSTADARKKWRVA